MNNTIPLRLEDTSLEIFARIAKTEAHKHNCTMRIDYEAGKREIQLVGDPLCAPKILEGVKKIFNP